MAPLNMEGQWFYSELLRDVQTSYHESFCLPAELAIQHKRPILHLHQCWCHLYLSINLCQLLTRVRDTWTSPFNTLSHSHSVATHPNVSQRPMLNEANGITSSLKSQDNIMMNGLWIMNYEWYRRQMQPLLVMTSTFRQNANEALALTIKDRMTPINFFRSTKHT